MSCTNKSGDAATIIEAYEELTPTAFAVWIRLMASEPNQLIGVSKIAKMINFSVTQTRAWLRELKFKGYIKISSTNPGAPSIVTLWRKAKLSGPNQFITLSNQYTNSAQLNKIDEIHHNSSHQLCKKTYKHEFCKCGCQGE